MQSPRTAVIQRCFQNRVTDMAKAPGIPVYLPIGAGSETRSCMPTLTGKLMANLTEEGESMASLSKQSDSTRFSQSPTPRKTFSHDGVTSSGSHGCLSVEVHFDGCHWSPVQASVMDARDQCWFLTVLTLLPFAHSTPPPDMHVAIMMEKNLTRPQFLSITID